MYVKCTRKMLVKPSYSTFKKQDFNLSNNNCKNCKLIIYNAIQIDYYIIFDRMSAFLKETLKEQALNLFNNNCKNCKVIYYRMLFKQTTILLLTEWVHSWKKHLGSKL